MRLQDPSVREQIVIIIMVTNISLLWVVKHELTNNLYFQEEYYASLIEQINEYKKENMQLEDAYLEDASFATIYGEAQRRGFVPATYIYMNKKKLPVAPGL